MTPGGPALTRDEWAARVAEWFPHLTDAKAGSLTFAAIDAHRHRIKKMLKTIDGPTATTCMPPRPPPR